MVYNVIMKTCTICNVSKNLDKYGILSRSSDGHYPQCKQCKSKIDKNYYELNKEQVKNNANEYYEINKEQILAKKDKEKLKEYNKIYKQENSEYISEYNKEYREKNKETIQIQRRGYKQENRLKINEYARIRLKLNPEAKLMKTIRNRTNDFLKTQGFKKKYKAEEYIGCSPPELKEHIEKQFKPGMTWENHGFGNGYWHVDHIIGLANALNEKHVYELGHYLNLRPMWHLPNIQKQDNADMCWQKLKRDKTLNRDLFEGLPLNPPINEFILAEEKITLEHKNFIKKYEWLESIGFGVRYVFTARYKGILGGVIMMAEPNSYQFDRKLEALIQRGACAGWTPKNLGSKLVMFSCKWMVQNTTKRIFTAYSDPEAGEIGTIYQACNFDYLGNKFGSSEMYILNGKKVTDRHFTRTSSMKKWAKNLDIIWKDSWCKPNGFQDIKNIPKEIRKQLNEYAKYEMNKYKKVKVKRKGKYVLLLRQNKREPLQKTWISLPYPKRSLA